MKRYGKSILVITAAMSVLLPSCIRDAVDTPQDGKNDPNGVTFVVSIPAPDGAFEGRVDATRAGYHNYSADADTETYGTRYGGYPDPESEQAAFERAVATMAADSGQRAGEAGRTRAIVDDSAEDNRIDEMVVLLFTKTGSGTTGADYTYLDRKTYTGAALKPYPGDAERREISVDDLAKGRYKALFIANSAASLADFEAEVAGDGDLLTDKTLADFETGLKVAMAGQRWNSDPGSTGYKPFPMSSKPLDFAVPVERDFEVYPVELVRALAKINISSTLDEAEFEILGAIPFNMDRTGFLVPAAGWVKSATALTDPLAVKESGDRTLVTDWSRYEDMADVFADPAANSAEEVIFRGDDTANGLVDEIFVFERTATDVAREAPCLIIGVHLPGYDFGAGNSNVRFFRLDLVKNHVPVNLVRNFVYDIVITGCNTVGYATVEEAYDHPGDLEVSIVNATDEDGMNDVTYNGQYQLTTDRSVVFFGPEAGSTGEIRIYTDYERGWSMHHSVGITPAPCFTTVANESLADRIILTYPTANTGSAPIISKTSVYAGELHKTVTMIQLPASENVSENMPPVMKYVGAFWRANQTGERLIRVTRGNVAAMNGVWNAFVLDGADWVVLDTKPSTDPNIGWLDGADESLVENGNDAGFDVRHKVSGSAQWVSGTVSDENPEAYFRIGLKSTHVVTAERPARYATLLVTYGDTEEQPFASGYRQILYLRQGEGADYLFEPGEGGVDGNPYIENRSYARKWSPYNLTTSGLTDATLSYEIPEARGGEWAEYPTMAGALFQFQSPVSGWERRAYHPAIPEIVPGYPVKRNSHSNVWDDTVWETCPPGYRRPGVREGDGTMAGMISLILEENEIAQSFFISAKQNTSAYASGYYADGWFDRRNIGNATYNGSNGTTPNSVADPTRDVAYTGMLMYNPITASSHYAASLFIPYAGYREGVSAGQIPSRLLGKGGNLYFWTSTPEGPDNDGEDHNAAYIFQQYLAGTRAANGGILTNTANAFSVRCVKEEYGIDQE